MSNGADSRNTVRSGASSRVVRCPTAGDGIPGGQGD